MNAGRAVYLRTSVRFEFRRVGAAQRMRAMALSTFAIQPQSLRAPLAPWFDSQVRKLIFMASRCLTLSQLQLEWSCEREPS